MEEREYYGIRKGFIKKDGVLEFELFKKTFKVIYTEMHELGYFQKYLGFQCENEGFIRGELGFDLTTKVFLKTGKENLWPVENWLETYSEIDMFTIIEFLYDCCSKPTKIVSHGWRDECTHAEESDDELGKEEFRKEINPILRRYKNVELSKNGEIYELVETGLETLIEAPIPTIEENINKKVEAAWF